MYQNRWMLILGIETSCDETGVALYDQTASRLLGHLVHSQVAMRRFKRTVEKTGLLTELRAREYYEKPTSERKRKLAAAVKRHHKRLRSQMLPAKLY